MAGNDGLTEYASVLSPESFCYLIDLDSQDQLSFQLMPDPISESKNAIYNEIPVVGRSLPHLGYNSSSSRMIALELNFVALEREGKYTVDWVKDRARWLESKVYPKYINGFTFPPPKLLLIVGNVIGLQCVMTSCTTNWSGPWDVRDIEAKPFRVSLGVQLQEVGQNMPGGHPFGHSEALSSANQATWGFVGEAYIQIPLADSLGE
jgi:hypothetical protein